MQQLEQRHFQGWIAIRRTKIQHVRGFAAKHCVHASLQFLDGKELLRRTRHHKRERVFRYIGGEAALDLCPAFYGEEAVPPGSPVSIHHPWGRRREPPCPSIYFD